MDTWVPNPNARPYIPKKYRHGRQPGSNKRGFSTRKCVVKTFQGGLVVVLLFTVVINIMFIVETSKKLKDPQFRDQISSSDDYDEIGAGRKKEKVMEMSMPTSLNVEVMSSKTAAFISVDGTTVLQDDEPDKSRGIHIAVLNQATGSVMSRTFFDTYSANEDVAMMNYLDSIRVGRILIFTIKDEGSLSLKAPARQYLADMGSEKIEFLGYRDTWCFVTVKGKGKVISESHAKSPDISTWAEKISLQTKIPLVAVKESECPWPDTPENKRRQTFCNKFEGYGPTCSCTDPHSITFSPNPLENNNIADVPVVVIASNRPYYLYRMLRTLLSTPGADPKMVTVFIDGYYEEPLAVTTLLGLKGIQHTPLGAKAARISQHYKASLTAIFNLYMDSKYAIVIEEDLDVSPDFFNFFSQTKFLLEEDPSVYCISAWNDQGYSHSCKDPSLLYRVETMPGLGWLLKRKLYKGELESQWPTPEKLWDWDMWLRTNHIRKNRECIIPDISRTYHFGSRGLNMNPYFQDVYFKNHSLLKTPNVKLKDLDKMKRDEYEDLITDLIKSAKTLDHSKDPCSEEFVPKVSDGKFVMYISMNTTTDFVTWKQLAKCYHLWDLDVRGFHKSMWRLFIKGSHVVVVGVPASAYSHLKPADIKPLYIPEPPKKT